MKTKQAKKIFHSAIDIAGFIKSAQFPRDFEGKFGNSELGRAMTAVEALTDLTLRRAAGERLIPISSHCSRQCQHADQGCTGFDASKRGCPGYYQDQ